MSASVNRRALLQPVAAFLAAAALWLAVGGPNASAQSVPRCDPKLPCRLDPNLPAFRGNALFKVAPNSERAVYVLRAAGQASDDLYSAPLAGGEAPIKLDVPSANAILEVAISPDGTRVIYKMSTEGSTQTHLYSVPIAGPASANVRLSSDVSGQVGLGRFQISRDSRKVVIESASLDRLRVVAIEGPANTAARLTHGLVAGGRIRNFAISDDSRSVVYLADQETRGVTELYRVPLTLSPDPDPPTAKLNAPLPQGGNVLDFRLAPGNGPVIYRADQDADQIVELFSVRLGGGGRVKLNVPLPPDWFVVAPANADTLPSGYSVTSDGARVAYEIQTNLPDLDTALYTVAVAGPASASVRLDLEEHPLEVGYQISPNGTRLAYVTENESSPNASIFSVPSAGPASASVLLNFPSPAGDFFKISPNSARVVWLFDGGTSPGQLVSTPIAGPLGQGVRINGGESPSTPFFIDASSTRVAYPAETVVAGATRNDLFSTPLNGSDARLNLTQSLSRPLINQLVLSPDGRFVVYSAIPDSSSPDSHLYSSRLAP